MTNLGNLPQGNHIYFFMLSPLAFARNSKTGAWFKSTFILLDPIRYLLFILNDSSFGQSFVKSTWSTLLY